MILRIFCLLLPYWQSISSEVKNLRKMWKSCKKFEGDDEKKRKKKLKTCQDVEALVSVRAPNLPYFSRTPLPALYQNVNG